MIKIDMRNIRELEKDLRKLSGRALPYAISGTSNAKAFATMKEAKEIVVKKLILRNVYTKRSIQVEPGRDRAIVGSIAPYMETQEFGGTKKRKGKIGTPIATSTASNEGRSAVPRKKVPTRRNQLKNINFTKARLRAKSKGQELLLIVREAVETNQRVFYWDTGREKKGIFKVLGGRVTKQGWPKGATIHMLHDLSETVVTIPKNPWLLPATMKVQRRTDQIYSEQLLRQITINQLFRERRR